jgi:eukaryotic-like serine/threonine-protein kinase
MTAIAEGTQFGPYRLIEKIGSGGMGEVYRALDTRLEREVAVKLISDNYLGIRVGSSSPSPATPAQATPSSHVSHERFLREARSSATLNHPNVCSIHDTGEHDGRPYLVMELLRGETLKRYLAQRGGKGLSPVEVVSFSQQAASALAAAHAKGIIHRDIKPANLFVVDAGRGKHAIKILDFGLAKLQPGALAGSAQTLDFLAHVADSNATSDQTAAVPVMATADRAMDLTSPGAAVGTVVYMSPEQAKGEPVDARSDLFSLGSVIYEMATGKAPFAGGSAAEVFAALLRENPPAVSSVNPAMPRKLDAIVRKLLAKNADQRYASADELQEALEPLDSPSGSAAGSTEGRSKWPWAVAAILLIAIAGGMAWWRFRPASAPPAAQTAGAAAPAAAKDSIILADFINHTGDPVFDTTLNQALQIELEQSPVINIVSPTHLAQSVKYLGKPEGTRVTPEIAREIGVREGIKAILTGTIANIGKQYVITLTAQNTATGDEIVSEQAQASDKEHVLDALGKVAAVMRGKLGEDLESIKKLDTPFGLATTSSLEAFRAYALGDKAHALAHDIPEAEGHYLRAIELDPNFAMAYARLGVVSINSNQVAKADKYFAKAYALSKNVSERERLYITGHYYQNVTGDMPKVIEALQEAIQTYPSQIDNYINITAAYVAIGDFEKALPYAQKAVQMQPEDSIAAENLLGIYNGLNRMDDARAEMERAIKAGLNTGTLDYSSHLQTYFLLGEPAEVQKMMTLSAGQPDEFIATTFLAITQLFSGEFRRAQVTTDRAYDQAGLAKAPDVQAALVLTNAASRGLAGLCEGNESAIEKALGLDKSRQTQSFALYTAGICGNGKLVAAMEQELVKKYPDDTLIQRVFIPLGKSFAALAEGRSREAIDDAEPAKPFSLIYPGAYVQGLGYLQLHDAVQAANAFRIPLSSPGGNLQAQAPFYAEAQLGLARAYAMAGDKGNAKKAYEAFFTTWKNADAEIPMLMAAKKEFASF